MLYHNTAKCLVKQIVATVPTIYIEELEHSITKFGKLVPYDLLNHLKQKYGVVSDQDLDANIECMEAKWMLPIPIEALFRQLRKAKKLLKKQAKKFLILRYAVQATIIYTSLDFSPNLATDGGCYNLIRPRLGLNSSSILP